MERAMENRRIYYHKYDIFRRSSGECQEEYFQKGKEWLLQIVIVGREKKRKGVMEYSF